MLASSGYVENPDAARRLSNHPHPDGTPAGSGTTTDTSDTTNSTGSGANISTASAMAISGVLIYNALSSSNEDAVESEWATLDNCLSHPTPTGAYHYHQWSPCYQRGNGYASTTVAPDMCKDTEACYSDPSQLAIDSGYSDTTAYGEIIGVTKDGHLLYGPYNSDGELWTCDDHDICNGTFIDGNYAYLSTTTFPYVLGCFGPATLQTHAATCSNNSCPSTVDSVSGA
jgi:hypothetical protein